MRRMSDERGAAALITAILLPVLLAGIGALVIDVGSWYAGRAQDQNGADAAAVAVARTCSAGACDPSVAAAYVNPASSPNGALAHQYRVCGVSARPDGTQDPNLPGCPSVGVAEDGTACPVPARSNYVDVLALPKNADGSGTLTSFFGHGDQPVGACAQSTWGAAGYAAGGIAITVSLCQWQADTANGAAFAPQPPYPPYPAAGQYPEHIIKLGHVGDPAACSPPQGGSALPGGFGEVTPNGTSPCTTTIATDGWYQQSTGSGNSDQWVKTCAPLFQADQQNQTVVAIPVFDGVRSQGDSGQYHLSNLTGFVITAYYFQTGGGGWQGSYVPGSPYTTKDALKSSCANSTCIVGYYVQFTDPDAPVGSGQSYGVVVPPRLAG